MVIEDHGHASQRNFACDVAVEWPRDRCRGHLCHQCRWRASRDVVGAGGNESPPGCDLTESSLSERQALGEDRARSADARPPWR